MPSADLRGALDGAVLAVLDAVTRSASASPRIVIDGRSGSGKSTLARDLVRCWPRPEGVQLLALDSLYPGWDGLAEGAEIVARDVLRPHAEGLLGRWRRWDWAEDRPAEVHVVAPDLPLIAEGAGALTREAVAVVDVAVWLEAPEAVRRDRALTRDGDGYRPHWERWAAQEERHIAANDPRRHALLVLDMP